MRYLCPTCAHAAEQHQTRSFGMRVLCSSPKRSEMGSNPFPWMEGRVVGVLHGMVEVCEFYEVKK